MQIDMHYYGTYAMAHAAGLDAADAAIVATSAQLVDDNNLTSLHEQPTGEGVLGVATAHHPLDAGQRVVGIGHDDSRLVWVPFHFLPGNKGTSFEQRVVCVKDSEVARTMVDYYTQADTVQAHREHAPHLLGIAAHVYADTFSHYGFSGIASWLNEVDADSIEIDTSHSAEISDYIRKKAADFLERFVAGIADAVRLGHGSVATYPDRPYLRWSYEDPHGGRLHRDNPATFLQACEALHAMFGRFRDAYYGPGKPPRAEFGDIRAVVEQVLGTEADAPGRVDAWKQALAAGKIGAAVAVPDYSPTGWVDALRAEGSLAVDPNKGRVAAEGYHFFAAADYHRNYVLKRLLPGVGLFVA